MSIFIIIPLHISPVKIHVTNKQDWQTPHIYRSTWMQFFLNYCAYVLKLTAIVINHRHVNDEVMVFTGNLVFWSVPSCCVCVHRNLVSVCSSLLAVLSSAHISWTDARIYLRTTDQASNLQFISLPGPSHTRYQNISTARCCPAIRGGRGRLIFFTEKKIDGIIKSCHKSFFS